MSASTTTWALHARGASGLPSMKIRRASGLRWVMSLATERVSTTRAGVSVWLRSRRTRDSVSAISVSRQNRVRLGSRGFISHDLVTRLRNGRGRCSASHFSGQRACRPVHGKEVELAERRTVDGRRAPAGAG